MAYIPKLSQAASNAAELIAKRPDKRAAGLEGVYNGLKMGMMFAEEQRKQQEMQLKREDLDSLLLQRTAERMAAEQRRLVAEKDLIRADLDLQRAQLMFNLETTFADVIKPTAPASWGIAAQLGGASASASEPFDPMYQSALMRRLPGLWSLSGDRWLDPRVVNPGVPERISHELDRSEILRRGG